MRTTAMRPPPAATKGLSVAAEKSAIGVRRMRRGRPSGESSTAAATNRAVPVARPAKRRG